MGAHNDDNLMNGMNLKRLEDLLIVHEGYRQFPYKDTVGKLTVGIGRNLDDVGVSMDEARYLLRNDIRIAKDQCVRNFYFFEDLDQVRQDALVNMCFNMGITRLKGFKKMLKALSEKDYQKAAEEALDSKWAKQVGRRSEDIVYMFIEGKYP